MSISVPKTGALPGCATPRRPVLLAFSDFECKRKMQISCKILSIATLITPFLHKCVFGLFLLVITACASQQYDSKVAEAYYAPLMDGPRVCTVPAPDKKKLPYTYRKWKKARNEHCKVAIVPHAFKKAAKDPSCLESPACACSGMGKGETVIIKTPERLLKQFPELPKERYDVCD